MNKQELIEKAVEKIIEQKPLSLSLYPENFFFDLNLDEKFQELEPWDDFHGYFNEFTSVEKVLFIGDGYLNTSYEGDIYAALAKFPNLKVVEFIDVDIDDTLEYIEVGLKKISKLEILCFTGTNIKEIPKNIFYQEFKQISLLANKFYKQNFHFKLKDNNVDLDLKIYEFGKQKIKKEYKETQNEISRNNKLSDDALEIGSDLIQKYSFEKHKWGNAGDNNSILILKDVNIINSISVYVLNENKQDKLEILKIYTKFFTELNNELDCFETDKHGNLELFFFFKQDYYENESIDYNILKQEYLNNNTDYTELYDKKYQVANLLDYIGGKNLIRSLDNQNKNKQIELSEMFSKNKYIEHVEIDNFKLFENKHTTQLSKINILIGKNSTGKTSFLQAIAFGLEGERTDQISRNRNYHEYINQKLIYSKPKAYHFSKITLNWKFDAEDKKEIAKILREKRKNINITSREQNIYSNHLSADKNLPQTFLVFAYGENLFPDRKEAINTSNLFIDYLINGDYKTNNIEALFSDYYKNLINPLYILNKLQDDELPKVISENKIKELIAIKELFLKTLNKFLSIQNADFFEIRLINEKEYKFIDKSKNTFNLYQLSEGYRTNISLIADIFIKIFASRNKLFLKPYEHSNFENILTNVKGTILIDEFDKHLHPMWQKSFIGILREVIPNVQFILSTHNVVALQSAEGQTALKMSADKDGKIKIEEKIIKVGDSIETLLNKFFDFNNKFFGLKTEKKLDEFYTLAERVYKHKDIDEKRFKELLKELLHEDQSEEIKALVGTEKAQLEYITEKKIEL